MFVPFILLIFRTGNAPKQPIRGKNVKRITPKNSPERNSNRQVTSTSSHDDSDDDTSSCTDCRAEQFLRDYVRRNKNRVESSSSSDNEEYSSDDEKNKVKDDMQKVLLELRKEIEEVGKTSRRISKKQQNAIKSAHIRDILNEMKKECKKCRSIINKIDNMEMPKSSGELKKAPQRKRSGKTAINRMDNMVTPSSSGKMVVAPQRRRNIKTATIEEDVVIKRRTKIEYTDSEESDDRVTLIEVTSPISLDQEDLTKTKNRDTRIVKKQKTKAVLHDKSLDEVQYEEKKLEDSEQLKSKVIPLPIVKDDSENIPSTTQVVEVVEEPEGVLSSVALRESAPFLKLPTNISEPELLDKNTMEETSVIVDFDLNTDEVLVKVENVTSMEKFSADASDISDTNVKSLPETALKSNETSESVDEDINLSEDQTNEDGVRNANELTDTAGQNHLPVDQNILRLEISPPTFGVEDENVGATSDEQTQKDLDQTPDKNIVKSEYIASPTESTIAVDQNNVPIAKISDIFEKPVEIDLFKLSSEALTMANEKKQALKKSIQSMAEPLLKSNTSDQTKLVEIQDEATSAYSSESELGLNVNSRSQDDEKVIITIDAVTDESTPAPETSAPFSNVLSSSKEKLNEIDHSKITIENNMETYRRYSLESRTVS